MLDYRLVLRMDEAHQAGFQALQLAEELALPSERVQALLYLAAVERGSGKARESAHRAMAALAAAEKLDCRQDLLGAAHIAMGIAMRASNLCKAREHFQQSLVIARQLGARNEEARMFGSLADVARRQNHLEEAVVLANQAIALRQELGDRTGEAEDRFCLGLTLLTQGARHDALEQLRTSVTMSLQLEHWREVVSRLALLGAAFKRPGEFGIAAACIQTGLELHQAWGMHVRKHEASLNRMREAAVQAGEDWPAIEKAVKDRRYELLEQATGIAAERWMELLPQMARITRPTNSTANGRGPAG